MKNRYVIFLIFICISAPLLWSACKNNKGLGNIATVNKPAPDFDLKDTSGKSWKLSELQGKVVFLNFWATWCPPCREEMPSMDSLRKQMAGKPFEMLTILVNDTPANGDKFMTELKSSIPVLYDPSDQIGPMYGLTGVPETFIIDPDGIIREKIIGPRNWSSPAAFDLISKHFPKK